MLIRFYKYLVLSGVAATLWAGAWATVQAQTLRVGVVNSDRILSESALAQTAKEKLDQEFYKRDHDLLSTAQRLKKLSDKIDKESASLSGAELAARWRDLRAQEKNYQNQQDKFREALNQRRNDVLKEVIAEANNAIKKFAQQNQYDLILQEAVYVGPNVDITEQVLKAMARAENTVAH